MHIFLTIMLFPHVPWILVIYRELSRIKERHTPGGEKHNSNNSGDATLASHGSKDPQNYPNQHETTQGTDHGLEGAPTNYFAKCGGECSLDWFSQTSLAPPH